MSLLVFLPTLNFLAPAELRRFFAFNSLLRVVPIIIDFVILAFYGAATAWSATRQREFRFQNLSGHVWPILRLGGAVGVLLGIVLLAVHETLPTRMLKAPTTWTIDDWNVHFNDMVAREGMTPKYLSQLHGELARCYARFDLQAALPHYASAVTLDHDPKLVIEMGDASCSADAFGRQQCYSSIAESTVKSTADKWRDPTTAGERKPVDDEIEPPGLHGTGFRYWTQTATGLARLTGRRPSRSLSPGQRVSLLHTSFGEPK